MNLRLLTIIGMTLALTACTAVDNPAPAVQVDLPAATVAPRQEAAAATAEPVAENPETTPTDPVTALAAAFNTPAQARGDVLILYGQVLDVNGAPVPATAVEIWQTDAAGVYDHPGDPGTANRDLHFQFYGTATTDDDGWYAFRTILPGEYQPRPRHIHFKVKQDDTTLLTSQFYFSDDIAQVQNEGIFRTSGTSGDLLLLQLVQGNGMLLANGQIVIDTGIGAGTLPLTPAQTEGPYYPVVSVRDYDNDLATRP